MCVATLHKQQIFVWMKLCKLLIVWHLQSHISNLNKTSRMTSFQWQVYCWTLWSDTWSKGWCPHICCNKTTTRASWSKHTITGDDCSLPVFCQLAAGHDLQETWRFTYRLSQALWTDLYRSQIVWQTSTCAWWLQWRSWWQNNRCLWKAWISTTCHRTNNRLCIHPWSCLLQWRSSGACWCGEYVLLGSWHYCCVHLNKTWRNVNSNPGIDRTWKNASPILGQGHPSPVRKEVRWTQ